MKTRKAFSLVEVLAAMVLIGIVIPAAMRGVTLSMQAAAHARNEQEAALLARQLLDEALVNRSAASVASAGRFADYPRFQWEASVTNEDFDLDTLTVTILWTEQGRERALSLSTMILPETVAGY